MCDALVSKEPSEADKVLFLSRQEVWPHRPDRVEVVETHMSWVFLAGPRVFKLKKPVRTAFLDFSTLAWREAAVAAELRLNRRLAPEVYVGCQALRIGPDGGLSLTAPGRPVDWLVEMQRLPDTLSLQALIVAGTATEAKLAPFATVLAAFYRGLPAEQIAPADYAEKFAREFAETARVLSDPTLGLDAPDLPESLARFEAAYDAVRTVLEERVRAGRVVEGHGDLRPEHVFLVDPPVAIDCLEFNRGLRTVDPFDEIAYLALECASLGADWVFRALRDRLEVALDDRPDPALLAFYWRYRALLRARIALLHLTGPVLRDPDKWRPMARRYIALADQAEVRCRP